ncbi:uncharacterized protein METZ01_LOCUS122500 [marine metagenome]|uniref:Amidohydrolase-related domain-containing protein n=1 Tax=marine metagenome TaxID=408172 RepID=A0A381XXW6_9ZZZZ
MRDGFKIIDCDRHVVEPEDLWDRYLEAPFKHYGVKGSKFSMQTTIGGKQTSGRLNQNFYDLGPQIVTTQQGFARDPIWRRKFKNGIIHNFDSQSYLADMDQEGVDVAVCFSGIGLYATWSNELDPDLSAAMCRAYNNWLYDFIQNDPERLKGVCLLPFQDLNLAATELRRCATELGMCGIFWRPNPHMGRLLSDSAFDPIFSIAEAHNINVSVHEGIQRILPAFAADRVETRFAQHATCHPMEQMGAILAMISGGVFDRFPGLTASYLESGAGWLPYWMERLDSLHSNPFFSEDYHGTHKPSVYVDRQQVFVSCEGAEGSLATISRVLSEDCVMWASDYPHPDAMVDSPNGVNRLVRTGHISKDFIRKILWDNPAKCFHIGKPAQ